jgi:hypothetical protein
VILQGQWRRQLGCGIVGGILVAERLQQLGGTCASTLALVQRDGSGGSNACAIDLLPPRKI